MKFQFKAKDSEGSVREGKIESVSREAAIKVLQTQNLLPIIVVQEKGLPEIVKELSRIWEGASQKELMVIFRELATLISAKVPIVPALRAISDQAENRYLRIVIKEVADSVEDGMALSESLAKFPDTFSSLSINMIKAGEVSGNLQKSIEYIADNIEKNYKITSRVKGALFYPGFVISVAVIIGFIAATWILPQLADIILELNVDIQWYTKAIIAVSYFLQNYWWAVLILVFGAIGGFFYYIRTYAGRREWHKIQLNIPILGKLFRYVYLARFANNFSVLLAGGIPIVRALMVSSEVVNNAVYQDVILKSADEVKTGGSISSVFSRSAIIPPIVSRIIRIGEETGKMSEVLKNVADFYDSETDNMTRNLSAMIEPILIILLGIGVGILVFSILMPIYQIAGKL